MKNKVIYLKSLVKNFKPKTETFPKDIVPGTYIISVNDSKITVEKTFEIE